MNILGKYRTDCLECRGNVLEIISIQAGRPLEAVPNDCAELNSSGILDRYLAIEASAKEGFAEKVARV